MRKVVQIIVWVNDQECYENHDDVVKQANTDVESFNSIV